MNSRLWLALAAFPGVGLFLLTIAFPATALIVRAIGLGTTPANSAPGHDGGYWALLGFSILLAVGGAVLSIVLALPGAYLIGRAGSLRGRPLTCMALATPLLLPPMVYAFGWQRLAPAMLPGTLRCIWVWAGWCWPIPALLIGTGWLRWGRSAYEHALLDSTPSRAFGRVVLPLLGRQATLGGLIVLALLLGEYSVPHACNLVVMATSLLGWATQSTRPADVLLPALPMTLVLVLSLVEVWRRWRRQDPGEGDLTDPQSSGRSGSDVAPMALVLGFTVVLPVVWLVRDIGSVGVLATAWRTYHGELLRSIAMAVSAGIVAIGMGMSVMAWPRACKPAAIWAVLFGALPGALVGEAVLVAYQPIEVVYSNWPLLLIGYVARYGWIGLLIAWLARTSADRDTIGQAATDGADEVQITWRLRYVPNAPLLLAGVAVVAALSLADLPVASMLQVPSLRPIPVILVEKFHRFEDGMLISLSLWLLAGAIPAGLAGWVALRRQR
ncbi:MAG: hypothetical protein GY778_08505 [bacterium]|nr:hypothetical protein [bacterium]